MADQVPDYNDAVSFAAARALLMLPRGEKWESIVHSIWHDALMWRRQVDEANKKPKAPKDKTP